jgi:hypothetical protein
MGQPTAFPEANLVLGPPQGCEDSVVAMQVRRLDGNIVSCWRLTPAEVEEVQRTGVVWLSVWGARTQPPVMVTAFKEEVV